MPAPPSQPFIDKWTKVIDAPTRGGNRVDYLIDGWTTFNAMYTSIQTTLKGDASGYYICLLGWWLDENLRLNADKADSEILALLARAAARGVQIRVMLYDNFLKSLYAIFFSRTLTPRQQVAKLNALPGAAAILDGHIVPDSFQSHHQKVLLVRGSEGLVGFCGGIDLSFDRIQPVKRHPGSPYHDVHCRIEGPAARDLVSVFVQRWDAHPDTKKAKANLRALNDMPPVRGDGNVHGPGDAYVGIVRSFVRPEGPCFVERSFSTTVQAAIKAARRFIYAEDQYMVSQEIAKVLGESLKHLQFVYFLIPHTLISDLPHAWAARRAFIETVKATAGERAFNDRFRVFYKLGSKSFGVPKRTIPLEPKTKADLPTADDFRLHTYVHAKTWIFDDELAIIGSPNCNRRGLFFDSEVAAAIFDIQPALKEGRLSFAQKLRIQLWMEHLGVSENMVRDALTSKLSWFDPEAAKYVRQYAYDDGSDADTISGWFFSPPVGPPRDGSNDIFPPGSSDPDGVPREDAYASWNHIIDPTMKPFTKCPKP
jgi:phosphatidylserine/phosphatidylglycerophosphate/cardiolipin synthase-like enzyme